MMKLSASIWWYLALFLSYPNAGHPWSGGGRLLLLLPRRWWLRSSDERASHVKPLRGQRTAVGGPWSDGPQHGCPLRHT